MQAPLNLKLIGVKFTITIRALLKFCVFVQFFVNI
jgi:hypothetical protein